MSVLLLTTGTSDEHQVLTMFLYIYIYITMKCLAFHVKFKGVHGV